MDARAYSSAVANGYLGGGRENPGNHELNLHIYPCFVNERKLTHVHVGLISI